MTMYVLSNMQDNLVPRGATSRSKVLCEDHLRQILPGLVVDGPELVFAAYWFPDGDKYLCKQCDAEEQHYDSSHEPKNGDFWEGQEARLAPLLHRLTVAHELGRLERAQARTVDFAVYVLAIAASVYLTGVIIGRGDHLPKTWEFAIAIASLGGAFLFRRWLLAGRLTTSYHFAVEHCPGETISEMRKRMKTT